MRTRLNVYFPPALAKQVDELAIRRRISRSAIVEAAVASYLSPDGADRMEAAFARRLDRLSRQVQRLERNTGLSTEALALFVRFWLSVTPPLPDEDQAAAQVKGRKRYEGFIETLGRRYASGKNLIDEYGFKIGDSIQVITPDKQVRECTIVGFFDLKVAQLNTSWCITTLASAQELFGAGDAVTSIEMQVKDSDVFSSDKIAANVADKIGSGYKVTDWKAQNEQLLSGLSGQSISSLMIQVFVMLSVVLGIASVLAITVMQKSRQIGILKAMGIRNGQSSLIFLFEGLILGVFGAITGVLLGLGLAASFTAFALNPDGTPVIALYIDPNFIALSGGIAVLACLLASLIPARKSSALNPIDIIRNN